MVASLNNVCNMLSAEKYRNIFFSKRMMIYITFMELYDTWGKLRNAMIKYEYKLALYGDKFIDKVNYCLDKLQ